MIAYAKENPGKVRYLSREVGSAADITMTWLFDKEGVEVEKIIGGSMQEIGIAVAAGEVDVALVFAEVALTHFQNEKVEVLLMTGDTAIAPWTDKPVLSRGGRRQGRPLGPRDRPRRARRRFRRASGMAASSSCARRTGGRRATRSAGRRCPAACCDPRPRRGGDARQGRSTISADPIVRELGLHLRAAIAASRAWTGGTIVAVACCVALLGVFRSGERAGHPSGLGA